MFSNLSLLHIFSLSKLLELRRARKSGWEGILKGHYLTRTIQTLFNVGFLDALHKEGWVDSLKFARDYHLDDQLLTGLCDALYARRILRKDGTRYQLDRDGRFLVEHDLMRGWFYLTYGYEDVLHQMEPLLRQEVRYGRELTRNGEYVARGSGFASAHFYFPVAAELVRQSGYRKILDLGCGDGTFLRYLCSHLPDVKGIGVDFSSEAIQAGKAQSNEQKMADRVSLHEGNIFNLDPLRNQLAGVDAVTSFFVFHEFCDRNGNGQVIQLLRTLKEFLKEVPIVLFEAIRPKVEELRKHPGPAVEYFLFHDLSGQIPQNRAGWKEIFCCAGFHSVQEHYLKPVRSSIYILK